MIIKFTLVFLLACFDAQAEDPSRGILQDVFRYCQFRIAEKSYNASDLAQCIDKLAGFVVDRENGRSAYENSQWTESYRDLPFGNFITTLLSANPLLAHQTSSFPADTTSGHYQSNFPAISGGTSDFPGGIGINLFDALSSISRYDDYKCVPRILCEMASGKLPGRSLAKQSSGFLENLGRNTFMEWLAKIDIAGSSPLLNFARAMILGYNYKGNSAACYRAFPRCPTDPQGLIYYLNNYKGGFFRFFNNIRDGKVPNFGSNYNREPDDSYYRKEGRFAETTIPISKQNNYRNTIFPRTEKNKNQIIFPDEKEETTQRNLNKIPEILETPKTRILYERKPPSFFK